MFNNTTSFCGLRKLFFFADPDNIETPLRAWSTKVSLPYNLLLTSYLELYFFVIIIIFFLSRIEPMEWSAPRTAADIARVVGPSVYSAKINILCYCLLVIGMLFKVVVVAS